MRTPRSILAALLVLVGIPAFAQTYVWTGELPSDWQGQLTPVNNGTANLYFSDGLYPQVTLTTSLDNVNSLTFANQNDYSFTSAAPLTLSITSGIAFADELGGTADFGSNLSLGISGSAAIATGEGAVIVRGQITGTGNLVITAGPLGNARLVLSNTGAGNTYVGNTTIGDGTNAPAVAFWNSSPFGTGTVTFLNGGFLIAHGTQTVSNPLVLDLAGSSNDIKLKTWDAPVTYSGPVTLANNTAITATFAESFLSTPTNDGAVFLPGPYSRYPIILSGNISGAHSLTDKGIGILELTGASNTYSGGTTAKGNIVFGTGSIPSTGSIQVNLQGYAGTLDPSGTSFATLLSHVTAGSPGGVGVDTGTVTPYSGAINLTGYANLAIGTATSAVLTGTITPADSVNFKFGGGGGVLYVNTPLANGVSTNVSLNDHGSAAPLTVYLQGANTYTGTTTSVDGILIFDGASAMPLSTQLTAGGNSSLTGSSYIGYTDQATNIASPAAFLSAFNKPSTWGVIGFDSHVPATPVSITGPIDLTGFNDGVFIGTATNAILSGALTPAVSTLRFTAVGSGVLTVDSVLSGPVSVMLGSSTSPGGFSTGTVIMNAPNTYSGGTTINGGYVDGITLGIGFNNALGTNDLTVVGNGGGVVGIKATAAGINLPNNIVFQDTMSQGNPQFSLVGTNNFTLSGNITGDSSSLIQLYNPSPIAVTISGNNAGYLGAFQVFNGTLKFPNNTGAGTGGAALNFAGSAGTVDFTGATLPIIERIHGAVGNLVLGSANLTIDSTPATSNDGSTFGGLISGTGSLTVTNNGTGPDPAVLLYGANTYSGGTTVTQKGLLILANNQGAGTGGVTVATSSSGAFGLDSGTTYSGPLTFTSGNLAGYGTFDPSGLGLAGTVNIGTNQGVVPGFPASNNKVVTGTLSFAGNMAFNNGGSFYWTLQDTSRVDGASKLAIAGNLTINATGGAFGLNLFSFDATGAQNPASNFNVGVPYSWVIATTGGHILNFNTTAFTIGVTGFENGMLLPSQFSLSVNGADNQLILNFTPVPEPSTYALIASGLGLVALAALRRRRALG